MQDARDQKVCATMKIQMLKYFVTLSESRSISEAAQKLYIAQPSLSKSLQLLEKDLGLSLFVRTDAGISLTPAGEKILPEARQVLAYYQGWKDLGRQAALQQVDIYTHPSFPDFLFPETILYAKKLYPDLTVNYTVCSRPQKYISRSTSKPVLSLFVCHGAEGVEKCTQLQGNAPLILLQGDYCCLVNARSPLARLPFVNYDSLKNAYLVLPESELSLYSQFDIIANTSRQRTIYVDSATNVIDLVHQDPETYAISYYPALKRYAGVASGELVPVPFENQVLNAPLVLSYSRQAYNTYPEIRALVQHVEKQIKDFLHKHGDAYAGADQ